MEGFWSLLRSWLRPHRGISQETLPLSLGFFEFVHNVRKRGKACCRRSLNSWSRKTLESDKSDFGLFRAFTGKAFMGASIDATVDIRH